MPNKNKGFTIIELIVVIAIIAVLSAVISSSVSAYSSKAKIARAYADVQNIEKALNLFFSKYGEYPTGRPQGMAEVYVYMPTAAHPSFGEPCLKSDWVCAYKLSEFYKFEWEKYNANYFVKDGFYRVALFDGNDDDKIGCGIVSIYSGSIQEPPDNPLLSYGTKYILNQDCPSHEGELDFKTTPYIIAEP